MKARDGDWWCPTCKFTIWGSKDKCRKCGYPKPVAAPEKEETGWLQTITSALLPKPEYWTPGDNNPKWDLRGPYSILKGGYSGGKIPGEPEGLIYPKCGCEHLEWCPQRHHCIGCRCYTCRNKPHKW